MLAERLIGEHWRVAALRLGDDRVQPLPDAAVRAYASAHDEPRLRSTLERIVADLGRVDALIFLASELGTVVEGSPAWHEQKARLRSLLLTASQLKPQLAAHTPGVRKTFMTVARQDGRFGLGSQPQPVLGAATFGLAKSLGWEWPSTFCRALDLAAGMDAVSAAERVIGELYDANASLPQVGWDGAQRFQLLPAEELTEYVEARPLSRDDVFLVSGGARGVTSRCVLELARQVRCGFLLVGRSQIDVSEPAWAEDAASEEELKRRASAELVAAGEKPTPVKVQQLVGKLLSQREVRSLLEQLRAAGARAEYLCCDVTDARALREQVQQAEARFGKVTGLIHGAGVLADKLVEKKTGADFDRVFDTKVEGLAALLGSITGDALRYVALFSSAAGFFGNRGQTDYSMANEALNGWALRLQRERPGLRVVSFNWGPWDGGMVTPGLRKLFEQNGVSVIDRAGGAELFVAALTGTAGATTPHLLVGSGLQRLPTIPAQPGRTFRLSRRLELAATPPLQDHRIGGRVVLPMVHVALWLGNSSEDVYPGYRFWRMEDLQMLKGIVFDEKLPEIFYLTFTEQACTREGAFCLEASLSAPLPNGREQPYYRARVILGRGSVERPQLSPEEFDLRPDPAFTKRDPYREGTLFHGPSFQGIQRVLSIRESGMTLECVARPVPPESQGQFPIRGFDPYIADACLQSTLVWVRERFDAGSLPVSLAWGEMYDVQTPAEPFFVTVKVGAVSATSVMADLLIHDREGRLFGRLSGAKVTVSKQLNRMFSMPSAERSNEQSVNGCAQ